MRNPDISASSRGILLSGGKNFCGFFHVALRNPAQRAVPIVDTDGIDGNHADLGAGQLADEIGDRANPVVALHQEAALRADHLPAIDPRDLFERGSVGRKKVELRAAAGWESGKRDQVDPGVLE